MLLYFHSVESSELNEVTVTASSLAQVQQIITKINYVNKESKPYPGARSAKLSTSLQFKIINAMFEYFLSKFSPIQYFYI
ncbi:hypothetical protein BpHYR1_012734 [Brachionus plicatilis]|uniref:Uncharacterized protein n=1 Tax=Brachionus plicatilis TaxID=10195 RepID=A0A3M7T1Q5_BRAPC|nr:hypothetical protein BpHYR1_012734 [Brachionus plicatilis]